MTTTIFEIIAFISMLSCLLYFVFSCNINVFFTNTLLKKYPTKTPNSFILIPSLVILILGFLYIVSIILFYVLSGDALRFNNSTLIYILVGAIIGIILGIINSIKDKKRLEIKYNIQIFSSNYRAIVGSNVIFFSSGIIFFLIGINLLVITFSN